MCEDLFSRFTEEFDSSYFRYKNRKRFKEGEYTELAENVLPTLKREAYWLKASVFGIVLISAFWIEIELDWTFRSFFWPLLQAFFMILGAMGGLLGIRKLERRRLLCELIVEHGEGEAALEEKEKASA